MVSVERGGLRKNGGEEWMCNLCAMFEALLRP